MLHGALEVEIYLSSVQLRGKIQKESNQPIFCTFSNAPALTSNSDLEA